MSGKPAPKVIEKYISGVKVLAGIIALYAIYLIFQK
jgi:hypothetical protein